MPSRIENVTLEIHKVFADDSVARFFGRKFLSRHEQRRRIVWVLGRFRTHAPQQTAGRYVPGKHGEPDARVSLCCIRAQDLEAHIFAEDDVAMEELLDRLLAAVFETCNPSSVDRGEIAGAWVSQEEGKGGETQRAEKVVLMFPYRLPVVSEIKPVVVITDVQETTGTTQPDGSFLAEPTS